MEDTSSCILRKACKYMGVNINKSYFAIKLQQGTKAGAWEVIA